MSSTPSYVSRVASSRPDAAGRGRAPGMDRREIRRRVCHMAPGFLPFLLWPFPHKDPLAPLLTQIILAVFVLFVSAFFLNWSRIARRGIGTGDRAAAILGYAVTVLATILLFPAHLECGLAVLAVLAFGDGAATIAGKLIGGPRLVWNRNKTFAGFLGFHALALPLATIVYWGETLNPEQLGPPVTISQALLVAAAGVVAGGIAESLPMKLNDNVRVGLAAAIGIVAAHAALFGL